DGPAGLRINQLSAQGRVEVDAPVQQREDHQQADPTAERRTAGRRGLGAARSSGATISARTPHRVRAPAPDEAGAEQPITRKTDHLHRSEEHTSELQSLA